MSIRVFTYQNCDSCRKAIKWLNEHQLAFENFPIRDQAPPVVALLNAILTLGRQKVLNTSGADYRRPGAKELIAALDDAQLAEHLSTRGNLIKRPFLIAEKTILTGFQQELWEKNLL